ncbi:MAG: four helix bundle protein [Pirellulales bacterium]|nr:four helix bundle protein [Pirellulales bacterium]
MAIESYRELKVWQRGMDIVVSVYQLTKGFPSDERFGLTSQMRRCAASIPANIAEGNVRNTTKDYLRFISIAVGSVAELMTFLLVAQRLGFGDRNLLEDLLNDIDEESRMFRGLQRSL